VNTGVIFGGGVIPKNRGDGVAPDSSNFDLKPNTPLENLSMATSRCLNPPGAFYKGPTRSRPQTANDQVMGIVCRA
jgi:hypothetical protein